jgi:hypothetical protein
VHAHATCSRAVHGTPYWKGFCCDRHACYACCAHTSSPHPTCKPCSGSLPTFYPPLLPTTCPSHPATPRCLTHHTLPLAATRPGASQQGSCFPSPPSGLYLRHGSVWPRSQHGVVLDGCVAQHHHDAAADHVTLVLVARLLRGGGGRVCVCVGGGGVRYVWLIRSMRGLVWV